MSELPEDIKAFIRSITLDLQCHRSKSEEELDRMFQRAYRLYVKYKVDPRHVQEKSREYHNHMHCQDGKGQI